MSEESHPKINLELITYQLREIEKHVDSIEKKLDEKAVGRTEFDLRVGRVEKLVYGAIGLALLAIAKALIELVVK